MAWPQANQFKDAVLNPQLSFLDEDLRDAEVICDTKGLPIPAAGQFGIVYQMRSPKGRWAVKCFTGPMPGRQERYRAISRHLQNAKLPFTVGFAYLEQGVYIDDEWYPVLKMDWVAGQTLNQFVKGRLDKTALLRTLTEMWLKLAQRLREANVTHADLQHGNVMLIPGKIEGRVALKLVDYDGMYLDALAGTKSGELGHPIYQHPQRLAQSYYGPEVDRFSHLVIYTALRAIVEMGPGIWQKFDNGDNLLFTQEDFKEPAKSRVLKELWSKGTTDVRALAGRLVLGATKSLWELPELENIVVGGIVRPLTLNEASEVEWLLKTAPAAPAQQEAAAPAPAPITPKTPSVESATRLTTHNLFALLSLGLNRPVASGTLPTVVLGKSSRTDILNWVIPALALQVINLSDDISYDKTYRYVQTDYDASRVVYHIGNHGDTWQGKLFAMHIGIDFAELGALYDANKQAIYDELVDRCGTAPKKDHRWPDIGVVWDFDDIKVTHRRTERNTVVIEIWDQAYCKTHEPWGTPSAATVGTMPASAVKTAPAAPPVVLPPPVVAPNLIASPAQLANDFARRQSIHLTEERSATCANSESVEREITEWKRQVPAVQSAYVPSGELPAAAVSYMALGTTVGVPAGLAFGGICAGFFVAVLALATYLCWLLADNVTSIAWVAVAFFCFLTLLCVLLIAPLSAIVAAMCVTGLGRKGKNRNAPIAVLFSIVSTSAIAGLVWAIYHLWLEPSVAGTWGLESFWVWCEYVIGILNFLTAALVGGAMAAEEVNKAKFCEDCDEYMTGKTLKWLCFGALNALARALANHDIPAAAAILQVGREGKCCSPSLYACSHCGVGYLDVQANFQGKAADTGVARSETWLAASVSLTNQEVQQLQK